MASDFVELGLEAADKLIEKRFHKLPNRVFDPLGHHTDEWFPDDPHYNINHPEHRKNRKARRRRSSSSTPPTMRSPSRDRVRFEDEDTEPEIPQYDPYPYEDVRSRRFPAETRGEPLAPREWERKYGESERDGDEYEYMPPQRRPKLLTRRSRSTQPYEEARRGSGAERARSSEGRDGRGPSWKRMLEDPRARGVAASVVGAAAGGLLAHQAGRASGRAVKGGDSVLLTIAGMVLGGIGGSEIEGVLEKKKEMERTEVRAWESAHDEGEGEGELDGKRARRRRRVWGEVGEEYEERERGRDGERERERDRDRDGERRRSNYD